MQHNEKRIHVNEENGACAMDAQLPDQMILVLHLPLMVKGQKFALYLLMISEEQDSVVMLNCLPSEKQIHPGLSLDH